MNLASKSVLALCAALATYSFHSTATAAMKDAEISSVVSTANDAEISAAQMAKTKATHADVKKFAQMMIDEHTKNKADGMKITAEAKMTPQASATSKTMATDAGSKLATLKKMNGAAFDKTYIEQQVMMHEQLLTQLDQDLIPAAQNPKLKTFLETTRGHVDQHLQEARKIQTALNK